MVLSSPASLTDQERKAAVALRDACNREGVHYDNLFQIVKYVLVAHSSVDDTNPKAAELRLQVALKRLKRRNEWAEKIGLRSVDATAALKEVEEMFPNYFVNLFSKDKNGCIVVAHHHAFSPIAYVNATKTNLAKFFAVEQYKMELAAADLDEARRGIAVVTISDGKLTLKRALAYLRLCMVVAKGNLSDMHPHRIKHVYSQVPAFVSHLIEPAKQLLPKKIASRIHVVKSMEELAYRLDQRQIPQTTVEWAAEREKKYQETIQNLAF